jgi:hypothetical protein
MKTFIKTIGLSIIFFGASSFSLVDDGAVKEFSVGGIKVIL